MSKIPVFQKDANGKIVRRVVPDSELHAMPKASLLRRLAALLYDMFLVASIWLLCGYVITFTYGLFGPNTSQLVDGHVVTPPVLSALQFIMMVSTAVGFYVWFWLRTGQTLGMIAWRIRAVSVNNCPMNLKQALLRYVLAWPSFWCLGLGYLYMYVNKDRDALHEQLSGTKTVLLPKDSRPF
ncbi:MAG TPA: RDD family protein [Pseudohongiella sp.]|nr:RDD family protein [Pseudohongiella sp.]